MENWLARIDLNTLRAMVGETILKAIKEGLSTNLERELAQVLLLKFGDEILSEKEIRLSIIDSLSIDKAQQLATSARLKIEEKSFIKITTELRKYFSSYNISKSKVFCDFLDVDKKFYKKKLIDERRTSESVQVIHNEKLNLKSYLHDYQKGVKDQIFARLLSDSYQSFMVQMPTGSGKTYTAQEVMVDVLRSPNFKKFVVWVVDSNELAEQALQSFYHLWKLKGDKELILHRLFGKFQPEFNNKNYGVVFIGFDKLNSIISNYEHKHYEETKYLIKNTELVIVDEAHKSIADTYNNCIEAFKAYNSKIIGLTATPGRNSIDETLELVDLFSGDIVSIVDNRGNVIEDPITYLQDRDYLANIDVNVFKTDVTLSSSDNNTILKNLAQDSIRNSKIVDLIRDANNLSESTLVFACSLDHVIALKILCNNEDIPVEFITGSVSPSQRINILERFKDREFFILLNLDILSTGIDVPNVNRLIITRPIGSSILYSQIIGRALRGPENGGNKTNTIVNLKDNLINYPDANSLFGKFELEWKGKLKY
jgi:DNA repair protein RadD